MRYRVTIAPTTEWTTTADAKAWLNYDLSDQDDLVDDIITGVRRYVEDLLGRSLMNQTVTLWLDADEIADRMLLPLPPFSSTGAITSVTTFDESNVSTTVSSGNYNVPDTEPAVVLEVGSGIETSRTYDAVRIVYSAGYGTSTADLPAGIRLFMKRELMAQFYERGAPQVGTTIARQNSEYLISDYRYADLGN